MALTAEEIAACVEAAEAMHHEDPNGNCAQSTACALCHCVGVSRDEAFRAMEGFGGGMGGFTQTCGAISGAVYVLSLANCAGIEARTSKAGTYALVAQAVEDFKARFGSTLCCDLKSPDPAITKGICDGYIRFATEWAASHLA